MNTKCAAIVLAISVFAACGGGTSVSSTDSSETDAGPSAGDAGASVADSGAMNVADAAPPARSTAASCTDGIAGAWQDITPPAVATVLAAGGNAQPQSGGSWGISSVVVDPSTPSTIYTSADGQGIWKSLDCGGTWTRIDDPSDNFAERTGSVCAWAFIIDPTDPQTLYANDGYGVLGVFKSTDGGKTFNQTFTGNLVGPGVGAGSPVTGVFIDGGFIGSIRMDPTNHLHLLVSPHHSCNAPYSQFCLLESFDGAATWTVVTTNIDVANADGPWADLTDATHFYVGGTPSGGLFLSTNGGTDWSEAAGITATSYGWAYHSAATGKILLPSAGGILQSADGVAWSVLNGTPQALAPGALTGDGKTLYLSHAFPGFTEGFYSASESDPSTWTALANPPEAVGFSSLQLDPVNHFLYATASYGGLLRYSTP